MAVRTVTVEMRLNATTFLADGRAVVRVNDEMARSFTRLETRATASSTALNDASRNVRQLGRRANTAERHIRELREEIDRLTASALAARGPVNIIQGGPGGGGGRGMGGGIFRAISEVWSALPAQAKAGIIAAAAAMAAILVTSLGAMISAALSVMLAGIVVVAMAGLAASASDAVQKAFADTGRKVMADLKGFSAAFQGPLVQAAHDFRDAWIKIGPDVNEMFTMMAKSVQPLVAGLIGFIRQALPGLKQGLRNAQPILAEFARDLSPLGKAVGYFFSHVTEGQGVLKGMRLLMILLAGTLKFVADTLNGLAKGFDFFTRNGESMLRFFSAIPGLGLVLGPIADKLHLINQAGKDLADFSDDAAGAQEDFATSMEHSAAAAMALDRAAADLNTRMDEMAQHMLGLSNANLDFNQGLLDLKQSFKDNGRSLDDHTAKGIANLRMVNQQIALAKEARDAFIEQNSATLGVAEATRQANAIFQQDVERINAVLRAAGLTAAQINMLTGQWMTWVNTPSQVAKSSTITTYYKTVGSATISRDNGQAFGRLPGGTHVFNRYGGLYEPRMAAGGLINLSGQARVYPAGDRPTYGFAERGTGGEAFIARNAPHDRSLAIANQAARWHGGQVVPAGRASGGGTVMNITVNAGMGTDGYAVGRQVVAAIKTYEKSNGTTWRSGTNGSWR